jgi:dTDP-4-dehydrorhamnose reductase
MRILLTGATGQVGGALYRALPPVVVTVNRQELDLSHPEQIYVALDRIAPDLIVNPAAYTAVDRAEDEREAAFRINAESPGAIAEWAAVGGVPLVHFSTDYVFDGLGHRPWREDDRANPLSVYGASKLAGEEAVRAARGPHLIVRASWVYAATGTNFLRTIARKAREWKELRIVADQFGAPTSARVIAEVVAGIVGASGAPLAERFAAAGGIINVAASGETSWHGFAVAIVEGLKARNVKLAVENLTAIGTEDYPTKAKRPANSRLDLTRLQQVFGIDTMKWDVALQFELDLLAKEFAALSV